jgi:hypothetical protein
VTSVPFGQVASYYTRGALHRGQRPGLCSCSALSLISRPSSPIWATVSGAGKMDFPIILHSGSGGALLRLEFGFAMGAD